MSLNAKSDVIGMRRAKAVNVKPRGVRTKATSLSPHLIAIIRKVIEGKQNKIVAYELGLSTGSVKVYLTEIYRILKMSSRAELIAWWYRSLAAPDGVHSQSEEI